MSSALLTLTNPAQRLDIIAQQILILMITRLKGFSPNHGKRLRDWGPFGQSGFGSLGALEVWGRWELGANF